MILAALLLAAASPAQPIACIAIDGDTVRCKMDDRSEKRIRLIGIDAPELPGHCARGRQCAPGDPYASKRLAKACAGG